MSNNSYFGGIAAGLKTLATGMKVTMKEYFTPKSTEQYPENRKTTLHVSPRFRGRLVFVRDENEAYKCVGCTLCEKSCPSHTMYNPHTCKPRSHHERRPGDHGNVERCGV